MAELLAMPGLTVRRLAAEPLHVLHCDPADADAVGAELGVPLPSDMLTAGQGPGPRALHLAPDEWLLIGWRGDAVPGRPHALVDVSSRAFALAIEGERAGALLGSGCSLDLDCFAPGTATRTLFGKVQILLERQQDCFRMQYWRSFDSYVTGFIQTAARDLPEPA